MYCGEGRHCTNDGVCVVEVRVLVGMTVGMAAGIGVMVHVEGVGVIMVGGVVGVAVGDLLPAAANGGKRHRFEFLLVSQSKAVLHGFIQQLLALI